MTYIKKMVIQGFKSFAKKTEIIFDQSINVIVGPNGSGKSNVSDALCFALGRLSSKSIRAEKTANLLFMGSKFIKPAHEASVEVVFDNEKKTFGLPTEEVTITRTVRNNGQSTYKINGEIKNRGDIIELLANAGIDPHGFNLVLQGQIQAIVKMHGEDRRKVIEEVAGIGIYETRKEKSIHELEKTEERLKEIGAILRERKAFLNNLERERTQALRFKELEEIIERCRYSILARKISDKQKDIESAQKAINEKTKVRDEIKEGITEAEKKIDSINTKIATINNATKTTNGLEREVLQERISSLKAEIEGLKVRIESNEHRKSEFEHRINQLKTNIPEYKREIEELKKESPILAKKQEELKRKKSELIKLEEEKNKVLLSKTELYSIKERMKEKEARKHRLEVDGDSIIKQIESFSKDFSTQDDQECVKLIAKHERELEEINQELENMSRQEVENNKQIAGAESQIRAAENIKERIAKIDVCPLCQNKMTEEHLAHVTKDSTDKIDDGSIVIKLMNKAILEQRQIRKEVIMKQQVIQSSINKLKQEYSNQRIVKEKKLYLKTIATETADVLKELAELTKKKEGFESLNIDIGSILEQYNTKLREIEEISSRTTNDIGTTLLMKERELEKVTQSIAQGEKDIKEAITELKEMRDRLEEKQSFLLAKEKDERQLSEKFKKMYDERDNLQRTVQEENYNVSTARSAMGQVSEQLNFLSIGVARLDAEKQSLEIEIKDVKSTESIKGSIEAITERLEKAKKDIQEIGSINMRALEVYDAIKVEYERVVEKVTTLEKEKEEILKIIEEIDHKKKKTFMKTFNGINDLFTRNFSELYTKGKAYLKIENQEDMFDGGVEIVIQLGKGKYFDVSSLSGGEQTLIALSLLFAIQEHKPYYFYVFDEIDAALDKRNSERLATLLNKYITAGQYIIVTHNDALIMNSKILYGVSMQEGVSRVLSLKLDTSANQNNKPESEKSNQS